MNDTRDMVIFRALFYSKAVRPLQNG